MLRHNVMVNAKYNIFATIILWKNIDNDTLTLRVKCYNGVSKHLRILSVIVKLYHESGCFLVPSLGMGLTHPFLVIVLRNVNKQRCCQRYKPGSDAKKCHAKA